MPTTNQLIQIVLFIAMLGVVVVGLRRWIRAGGLSESIFRDAPARDGMLHLHDALLALGGWVVGMALGAQLLGSALPENPTPSQTLHATAAASIGATIVVVLLLLRASFAMNHGLAGLGLGVNRLIVGAGQLTRIGVVTIGATFLSLAAVVFALSLLGIESPPIAHDTLKQIHDGPIMVKIGLSFFALIVAPFNEEIIFRGFCQTAVRRSGLIAGRWPTILATAAVFALVHGNVAYQALPGLFVLGIGLGYAYERTGSLWTSILIHAVFNTINVIVVLASSAAG